MKSSRHNLFKKQHDSRNSVIKFDSSSHIAKSASKLRIARPPKQISAVSASHWDQISNQLHKSTLSKRPASSIKVDYNKQNESDANYNYVLSQLKHYTDDSAKYQSNVTGINVNASVTTRPFSFLSNIGGKDIMTHNPYNRHLAQGYITNANYVKDNQNELRQSKITIITDANVDHHEYNIEERRKLRKNRMNLTSRGLGQPKKTKVFRPSSSRPNLHVKNLAAQK